MFRDFRRHYHKVKEAALRLAASDSSSFNLQIKFEETTLSAQSTTPNEEATVRFVVLMHRYLSPADALYFSNVWSFLKEHFSAEISREWVESVDAFIESMNRGYVAININGEDLTAEKIYQTLSSGEYFDNNEEAKKYLLSVMSMPTVGHLFWHQFYDYTLTGYKLASALFSIILEVEKSEKYKSLFSEEPPVNHCIYCLTHEGDFTAEEHVIPESLGNDVLLLPKGFVCKKCNNGVLSVLDEAFMKFEPIAWLQLMYVPYTKAGKLPEKSFQNMSVKKTGPRNIHIKAKDRTGGVKNVKEHEDGTVSCKVEWKGKRLNPNLLARELYKIALGTVAIDYGHEHACSSKFNAAREFIQTGAGANNKFLMRTNFKPHPQIRVTHIPTNSKVTGSR